MSTPEISYMTTIAASVNLWGTLEQYNACAHFGRTYCCTQSSITTANDQHIGKVLCATWLNGR